MKQVLAVIVAAALALGPSAQPVAARPADASVTSLSLIPSSGKAELVIGVAGGLEVRDFTLRSPDRIVLDLTGASLGLVAKSYDRVARGGISDVRFSQYRKNTVRVVVYLDGPHEYQISKSDGDVRVSVTIPAGSEFAAWHIGGGKEPSAAARSTAARDERPAGEPKSGPERTADRTAERTPDRAPERATATEAQAAQNAKDMREGKEARESREARDANDNRPRANVQQAAMGPMTNGQQLAQQRSQQPRITVTYQGSDIRDVLAAFASFSGRTIIPSTNVPGLKVDAEIKDQPWDVALQAILNAQGLAATEDANGIIIVDTQERIAARQQTEPLITRIVRLNYQRATPIASQLQQRLLQCLPSAMGGTSASAADPRSPCAASNPDAASPWATNW